MLHLNVGPSALALGLLVPMTLDAGLDVCVVGKPGEESPEEFALAGSGPGGRLSFREVSWFVGPSTWTDLPHPARIRMGSPEPLLITASLRAAISKRHEFMAEVLAHRPTGAETIVLACENAPHPDYAKVEQACQGSGALMLRTVVNRMCLERERDSYKRRTISVHRLAEWLVQRPPDGYRSAILDALRGVKGFEVVDDIEARHDRKLWMVNGGHQALALMARRANADNRAEDGDHLHKALSPAAAAWLGHLHGAMNEALRIVHPELEGSTDYGMEHVEAYSEHKDSVARVLAGFRRLDLAPFVKALDERIAAPARICHHYDRSVDPFRHVIDVFLELVANIDAFQDNELARATRIPAASDAMTVAGFARLLDPWAGDTIEKQVTHFAQLLSDHREAFAA